MAGGRLTGGSSRMRIDCVIVHYHAPELACRAVAALHADAAASGLEVDVVLVDNGSDEEERRQLANAAARVVRPGRNLGYAAGVNFGVAETAADHFVVLNEDVEVIPGCLARLVETLRAGSAAAGPKFYLDREKRFVLPPNEVRSRKEELLRRLAGRGDPWMRWARRSWRRHARRHWLTEEPLATPWLSGAMLAIRRDAWQASGGFDEAYRLYFDEVDWLLRLWRRGLESTYVPQAEAFHWYNQSASRQPDAPAWFEASARIFAERHYGSAFLALIDRLGGHKLAAPIQPVPLVDGVPSIPLPAGEPSLRAPLWVELSTSRARFPGAAAIVAAPGAPRWRVDGDLLSHLKAELCVLSVVDARGVEWAAFELVRGATQERPVSLNTLTFRPYAEGDEAMLNRGFNAAFGLERPLGDWRWKFPPEPEGRPILVAVDARNEVFAHFAAVPLRFQLDGQVLRVGQAVDLFCLRRPDFAHDGVFAHLGREFYRTFCGSEGMRLLFGFPGERSLGIGRAKLGYGEPVPIPVWRRAVSGSRSWWTRHTVRQGFDAAAINRLWQRAAARYPVAAVRDAAWLERRFTRRPDVEYVHLAAWRRGEVHAWAVLRLQDGTARWAELVWDGEDARALLALDDAAGRIAGQGGAAEIEMWLANDPAAEEVFTRRGWTSTPHPQAMLCAISFQPDIDADDVPRRLYFTLGDSDLV